MIRKLIALVCVIAAAAASATTYIIPTQTPMTFSTANPTVPAPALAVGYTTQTFSGTTLDATGCTPGHVCQNLNFYGSNTTATQNSNGTITVAGPTINPQLGTAKRNTGYSSPYQFSGRVFGCGAYIQATLQWPGGNTGQAHGSVQNLTNLVGGTGYVDGVYTNVPFTGGTGTNLKGDFTVSGGVVTAVSISNGWNGGSYSDSDSLAASNSNLGGSGSGFSVQVLNAYNGWPALWAFDIETMSTGVVNSTNQWPGLTTTVTAGSPNIAINFNGTNVYGTKANGTTWSLPAIAFSGSMASVTGLTAGTHYFVVNSTSTTVQVSATNGGTAITPGGSGTATPGLVFGDYVEWDLMEYLRDTNTQYAMPSAFHNWGSDAAGGSQYRTDITSLPIAKTVLASNWNTSHQYAGRWIPATGTTQGSITEYVDGVQVSSSASWNQYSSSNLPPHTQSPATVGAIIDNRHLVFMINGAPAFPVTVSDLQVWQGSGACNMDQT